jgi:hypothetical protein
MPTSPAKSLKAPLWSDVVLTQERPQLERQRELEREAREQEERQS